MQIQFELGCMQHAEWIQRSTLLEGTSFEKRWREHYRCVPLGLELPETGTENHDVVCPLCESRVVLKVSSPSRLSSEVLCGLMVWAIVFIAAGFGLYFAGPKEMKGSQAIP